MDGNRLRRMPGQERLFPGIWVSLYGLSFFCILRLYVLFSEFFICLMRCVIIEPEYCAFVRSLLAGNPRVSLFLFPT